MSEKYLLGKNGSNCMIINVKEVFEELEREHLVSHSRELPQVSDTVVEICQESAPTEEVAVEFSEPEYLHFYTAPPPLPEQPKEYFCLDEEELFADAFEDDPFEPPVDSSDDLDAVGYPVYMIDTSDIIEVVVDWDKE